MADGQEPTQPIETGTPPEQPTPTEPPAEPPKFDAEYVSGLRGEAAKYRKELRAAEAQLKQFQTAQEAAATAELEAQGKWETLAEQNATRATELEAQLLTQQNQLADEQRSRKTMGIAAKMGFDPTDANVMAAVSSVDISEADADAKIQQALEELKEARPYLVQGTKTPNLAAFNPGGQPQLPRKETDAERRLRLSGGGSGNFLGDTDSGGVVWPKGKPD